MKFKEFARKRNLAIFVENLELRWRISQIKFIKFHISGNLNTSHRRIPYHTRIVDDDASRPLQFAASSPIVTEAGPRPWCTLTINKMQYLFAPTKVYMDGEKKRGIKQLYTHEWHL
jgi:hypothetical protein